MRWERLRPALEALAEVAPTPLMGLVYGAGFEDRAELLARIAARWPLIGNDEATVARLKDPISFFGTLDRLGIPHPATAIERPAAGAGWLAKVRGGSGGSHIAPSRLKEPGLNVYYQERVEGRAVSALFVADGKEARALGFSEQWAAPSGRSPWRYGGAARPAALPAGTEAAMTEAVEKAAGAFALGGLGSADFIVGDGMPLLLEINPRPGATLDIFDSDRAPLLRLHAEGVKGGLPPSRLHLPEAMASATVFAPESLQIPAGMVWPEWAADRPKPAEWIDKSRPICTVLARAKTREHAKHLVEARISEVLTKIQKLMGETCERDGRRENSASRGVAERQRQGGAAR